MKAAFILALLSSVSPLLALTIERQTCTDGNIMCDGECVYPSASPNCGQCGVDCATTPILVGYNEYIYGECTLVAGSPTDPLYECCAGLLGCA